MERKLIITKWNHKIVTSILEDDEIVELHCCDDDSKGDNGVESRGDKSKTSTQIYQLGNIYVGRVKNIVPNIGAAFVEVAPGVECYYSISQNESPVFTKKIGKKPLCIGDELLVQISREASKTKAPTVSSKLEFTGRYIVLSAGNTRIGISKKLDPQTREQLKAILQPYQHENFGLVARTNAKDASKEDITDEIDRLISEYEALVTRAQSRTCYSCLKQAPKEYITNVRNIYGEGLLEIKVEDSDIYEELKAYMEQEQPQNLDKLTFYDEQSFPLTKLYNLEQVVEKALKERVWLKNGGYLVIQPTEALTVIDVNSGKYVAKKSEDESYLKINLEAAKEAAKQIRLRNLSGIIIVDFINLNQEEDTRILLKKLQEYLSKDPIQTTVVDITKLHLVEITRKKVRKMLYETV